MANIRNKSWNHFRVPRRVRRIQTCAVLILITTFTFVTYNIISIMRTLGYIENHDVISLNPEYSEELRVTHSVQMAYSEGWVGFSDIKDAKCRKLFGYRRVTNSLFPTKSIHQIPNHVFEAEASNSCAKFKNTYGYHRYTHASQEEREFPIAFIILFHKDFHQVHLLLRAIYYPHNVYCLVPDAKGKDDVIPAAKATASCFSNVFVSSRLENITYKGFSRLMADIHCMKDLLRQSMRWKYVINMPGQQFPLKTNLELVKILKNFQGANDIEGVTGLRAIPSRFKKKYILSRNNDTGEMEMIKSNISHPTPPHGLKVVKGSAYNTYSRAFVRFVLSDGRVRDLLEWTREVLSPDEYFWAMANHNPSLRAPGGYSGIPSAKPHFTVFAIWQGENPCATWFVREICILSPADIRLLLSTSALFANKFYLNHFPSALHCLDQMIFNRTISGYVGDMEPYGYLKFAPPEEADD